MEENKKNNTSLIVLICLIVAVVVCCGVLAVKQLTKNTTPKNMFVNGIENMFKKEKNVKVYDTVKAEVKVSFDIKTDLISKDVLDLFNKMDVKLNADIDKKNKLLLLGLDTNYDKDEVLDAKVYFEENSLYVYLNNIFDKWIKVDSSEIKKEDFITTFTLNQEDIDLEQFETFGVEVKEALLKSLKNDYFIKEKEDDYTKVTLTITKDNILDIIDDFIKNLKDSSKFKDVSKKMFSVDMDTILTQLEESLKQVSSKDFADLEDIRVSIYLDKDNNINKITVDTIIEGNPVKLEVEMDENNFSVSVYMMGIKIIGLSVKQSKSGDTTKTVINFNMVGTIDLTANIESTIKYNEKVDKVDVSNNINASEITEAQGNAIADKLMRNKGLNKFIEAIQKVVPQNDYDLDYNYQYSY